MSDTIEVTAPLWRWSSDGSPAGGWYFVTVDGTAGEALAAHEAMRRLELGRGRGFGSVKVRARIGDSEWATSVFPSKHHQGFVLPIKAAVRRAEGLAEGDPVSLTLALL